MGKHGGKSNLSNNDKSALRNKKKEEFKKNLTNCYRGIGNNKQQNALPRLKSHKTTLIYDLEQKKQSTARDIMIENLNNKLDNEEIDVNKNISMGQLIQNANQSKLITEEGNKNYLLEQNEYLNRNSDVFFASEELKGNKVDNDFSRKNFMKDLKNVVESADVILEVLDARDPMAFRSKELENYVKSFKDKKKLILVVNKIDLVPQKNAFEWKEYLRQEYPTVLFKANTQSQNSNLSNVTVFHSSMQKQKDFVEDILDGNKAIGGEDVMNILKNYCRVGDSKKSLTVGIVGFPNVGKSSIINSLKRSKAAGVSSTPGHTGSINEIIIDKNIKLLDSPGVVCAENSEYSILTNTIRTENIEDPVKVVKLIVKKVQRDEIIKKYELTKDIEENKAFKVLLDGIFNSQDLNVEQIEKFLCYMGMKFGKYAKGGIVDLNKTACTIIKDWNSGKLKYMTPVPELTGRNDGNDFNNAINDFNKQNLYKNKNNIEEVNNNYGFHGDVNMN